jgi:hypothetical protein
MGTTDAACGSGGKACAACTGGQKCDDKHCVAPATCSASNCPSGCCDDSDKCQTDGSSTTCGNTGGRCQTCSGTQNCTDGVCVRPCNEDCAGCCDSTGACLASVHDSCGVGGLDCTPCTADQICTDGKCIGMGCKATCAGCCSGDDCNAAGNTNAACGSNGNACIMCGTGQSCVSGACRVDPSTHWDLDIVSGTVPVTDSNNQYWDAFHGNPDPYVKITLDFGGANTTSMTPYIDNTTDPVWNNTTAVNNVTAEILQKTTYIELFDYDPFSSDQSMGLCTYTFANADFDGALHEITCPGTGATGYSWKLRFKLLPHS